MSRLTEREIQEIRRAQGIQPAPVRAAPAEAALIGRLATYSGLAEIAWLLRHKVAAPVRRALRKRRAARLLHGLNDHMLRDIGLERSHIDIVVDKLSQADRAVPAAPAGPLWALGQWFWRRGVAAELSRLDDRMLRDIGVSRGEIPALVNRMALARGADTGRPAKLSGAAAGEIAKLDAAAVTRLGFVKTSAGGVPGVTAARKVAAR